jgi:hypothetical protein
LSWMQNISSRYTTPRILIVIADGVLALSGRAVVEG